MSRIGCMAKDSQTRLGMTLWGPWRLGGRAERHGAGAPAGLQNRSAVVARRWVGSIPAPLRFTGKPPLCRLFARRWGGYKGAMRCRCRPLNTGLWGNKLPRTFPALGQVDGREVRHALAQDKR